MKTKKTRRKNRKWTKNDDKRLWSLWGKLEPGDTEGQRKIARTLNRTLNATKMRMSHLRKETERERQRMADLSQPNQHTERRQQRLSQPASKQDLTEAVVRLFEEHSETKAKQNEYELLIHDTIEKLEVLLARLKKAASE